MSYKDDFPDPFFGNENNENKSDYYNNQNYNNQNYNQNYNLNYNNQNFNNTGIAPYNVPNNSVFIKRVLPVFLAVLLLISGFIAGYFTNKLTMSEEQLLAKWILETIDSQYLYGMTAEEKAQVLANMGKGAVYPLDQYSDFYSPDELNTMGEYAGIGVSLGTTTENGKTFTFISQVYGNTPANGKIKKNDRIVSLTYYTDSENPRVVSKGAEGADPKKIKFEKKYIDDDGDDVSEYMEYSSASEIHYTLAAIPEGIEFDLEIRRNTDAGYEEKTITIARKKYEPAFVDYYEIDNNTAVVELMSFSDKAKEEMDAALKQFKDGNKKNLILDLRNNGGGDVKILKGIASNLITDSKNSSKVLVGYSLKKDGKRDDYYTDANNYNSFGFKKIVVLINENSASASEALLGAMLDYRTCNYTVGVKSYGKGIRQATYLMPPNYNYGIKLTDAYMYWPVSGTCIHDVKITPDKIIKNSLYYNTASDLQLQAALEYIIG